MIDQATTDMLKSMKMSAMAQEFEGKRKTAIEKGPANGSPQGD